MVIIEAVPHTTFNHPSIGVNMTDTITEHKYPSIHNLLTLYSGSRPHHPAITLNKDFYIPRTFNRQLNIIEQMLAPLTDEELRALAMMRGFEKYVHVVHTYHLYLVETFLNAVEG